MGVSVFVVVSVFILSIFISCTSTLNAPDLPASNRVPQNVLFDVGSLIIDMGDYQIEDTNVAGKNDSSYHISTVGNINTCGQTPVSGQWCSSCVAVNSSKAGLFNMYSYGFAIRLLYTKIPLFWAVKSGKTQNTDFDISSASAKRAHPTRNPSANIASNAWGSTSVGTYSFRGGPIIIRAADAQAAITVLSGLKMGYTGNGRFESVVIFNLTTAMTIDVRHNLTHLPYVYASTLDGTWCDWSPIPLIFMNAGLIEGPINQGNVDDQHHFSLLTQSADLIAFSNSTCSTLFAEPHIIFDPSGNCAQGRCVSTPEYRAPLIQFVESGGNFWVQCAGIPSYENSLWPSQYFPPNNTNTQTGVFLSKYGVQGLGNLGNEWGGRANSLLTYPNPDLPISQFVGQLANVSGTISAFYLRSDPTPGAAEDTLWANNGFSLGYSNLAGGSATSSYNAQSSSDQNMGPCDRCCPYARTGAPQCPYNNLLPANRKAHFAAGAKLLNPYNTGTLFGGYVWMLGGHSWYANLDVVDANIRNGQRMLMNALLTPAVRPANCGQNFCSQNVDCTNQYGTGYSCISSTCSASASPSISLTSSKSVSASSTISLSMSITPSRSFSSTSSISITSSPTPSISVSYSSSNTNSATRTPSISVSYSSSNTNSATRTPSTTPSLSSTPSTTPSLSSTRTPSVTGTPVGSVSVTPSITPTTTPSLSSTRTPSVTGTPVGSVSVTPSITPSISVSLSSSNTNTATRTPSVSVSLSSSNTNSATRTPSSSQTPSNSPSNSVSGSQSASPVAAAAGGGGSNTGTIVGAVVGSVAGVATVAGLVAAGAGAAVLIAKKVGQKPLDTGAFMDNHTLDHVSVSPIFQHAQGNHMNPLYSN